MTSNARPILNSFYSPTTFFVFQMSLVDLGKKLLEAARAGQDDEVRILMANGAPFTTDWVNFLFYFLRTKS